MAASAEDEPSARVVTACGDGHEAVEDLVIPKVGGDGVWTPSGVHERTDGVADAPTGDEPQDERPVYPIGWRQFSVPPNPSLGGQLGRRVDFRRIPSRTELEAIELTRGGRALRDLTGVAWRARVDL